jgi:hypothetical protein
MGRSTLADAFVALGVCADVRVGRVNTLKSTAVAAQNRFASIRDPPAAFWTATLFALAVRLPLAASS